MKIFNLPDLGEGLAEAEIHAWHVRAGDVVQADQPLVSVETAKAVVEVPAPCSGKIVKLYGEVGDVIKTHAPLVEFAGDKGSVVGALEESSVILAEPVSVATGVAIKNPSVKIMPAVRALAKELGIDLATVKPGGTHGQITAEDVRLAARQHPAEALHGVRRSMAQVMIQSGHEVVPATIMEDADITDAGPDTTVLLIQAMIAAAKVEPALNATFDGDKLTRALLPEVHPGLAMDSPEGLFVPVLKNAAEKSATELRQMIKQMKQAVLNRTLTPEELHGATIMLSNFGTIAGKYASPVIVPPLVAILGCGKLRDAVVVKNGQMVIRRIAPLSLTFDHRAVTGGEASRYLAAVIRFLEDRS